jgi:uncharacterized damage-inducible protein DinB
MRTRSNIAVAVILATLSGAPAFAQTQPSAPDPALVAARMATGALKMWLGKSAALMNEEDFAFKPTPEVRSFGQILAHVADLDYEFCAAAIGEKPPVSGLEKAKLSRSEIIKAQADAFAYCDGVNKGMTDATARAIVDLRGQKIPAASVLLFRTHHESLHYGNLITYIRLRGKVPPSSASPINS